MREEEADIYKVQYDKGLIPEFREEIQHIADDV